MCFLNLPLGPQEVLKQVMNVPGLHTGGFADIFTPEEQQEGRPTSHVMVGHRVTQWSKQNPRDLTAGACVSPPAVTSSFLFMAGESGSFSNGT